MSDKQRRRKQLLRIAYPKLYEQLISELENYHIHSFDVQATCIQDNKQVEIEVRYGDGYIHEQSKTFPNKDLNEKSDDFTNFCKEIGETCKETLIADYFKMVKP